MKGRMSGLALFLLACVSGSLFDMAAGFRPIHSAAVAKVPKEFLPFKHMPVLSSFRRSLRYPTHLEEPFSLSLSASDKSLQTSRSTVQKISAVLLMNSTASPPVSGDPHHSIISGPTARKENETQADTDRHHLNKGVLITLIVVPLCLGSIMISSFISWMCRKSSSDEVTPSVSRRQSEVDPSDGVLSLGPWLKGLNSFRIARKRGSASALDYAVLQVATNNFSTDNLLGRGGSGGVYKARLDDDFFAAVKKLDDNGKNVEQDFQAEVDLMSRIRHQNLVSLLGFCRHENQHLLVYELMQNGSLEDQLHGPSRGSALSWHLRIKIALDAARGLEHLHERCNPSVIHRDFKSSNVLLDASFNAKLSDFGLAVPCDPGSVKGQGAGLQGTFGYVAPEYMLDGTLSEKSDVYAFGVVLLELITGRKPIDMEMPTGCQSLVTWATPQLTDRSKLQEIVDPAIKDSMNLKHLYQVAAVAALCVQSEPSYRPLIADVVNSLIPLVPIELGGALRSAEPGANTEMKYFAFSQHEMKSFSFSHYSSKVNDSQDHMDISMSARMADEKSNHMI